MTTNVSKQSVLGVAINPTTYQEVVSCCADWIRETRVARQQGRLGRSRYICVTSVHGIMTARKDLAFKRTLNEADIATPDGMPVSGRCDPSVIVVKAGFTGQS